MLVPVLPPFFELLRPPFVFHDVFVRLFSVRMVGTAMAAFFLFWGLLLLPLFVWASASTLWFVWEGADEML